MAGSCARQSFDESRQPLPAGVSFTAIYSRRDGIVDWRACVDPEAHAVEVTASHVGMAVDPRVMDVVTGALQLPAHAGRSGSGQCSKSIAEKARSFESWCSLRMERMVPLRDRITSESVVQPPAR